MPRIVAIIVPEDTPTADNENTRTPEAMRLYMPSDIQEDLRNTYCDAALIEMEADLRYACATESLQDLRRQLHLRVYMVKLKINNVTGQKGNTRARGLQETIEGRVADASARYRTARKAFIALKGKDGPWKNKMRELKGNDVIGLGERAQRELLRCEDEAIRSRAQANRPAEGTATALGEVPAAATSPPLEDISVAPVGSGATASGESRRTVSWIWVVGGLEDEGANHEEGGEGRALTTEMNDGIFRSY